MIVIRVEGHITMSPIVAHGTINVVEETGNRLKVIWWILVIAFAIVLASKKWDWPFKWPSGLRKKKAKINDTNLAYIRKLALSMEPE
jgi:hypothetical protein